MSSSERARQSGLPWPKAIACDGTYMRMEIYAGSAANELVEAWKRPVRHNRSTELAALWHTLRVADDCSRILGAAGTPDIDGPLQMRWPATTPRQPSARSPKRFRSHTGNVAA